MIRRLSADRRAMAATEFAICLPFLIVLFVGCYQFSDAIMAYRKLTLTARTIADLTSQNTVLAVSDVDAILSTSTQIMLPYDASTAQLTVEQLKIDGNGNAQVDWGRGRNIADPVPGTKVNLSKTILKAVKNGYVIVATANYTYKARIGSAYFGDVPLSESTLMLPRGSASVRETP